MQARNRKAFRAADALSAAGFVEAPGITSTSIEQYRNHDQIDPGPRTRWRWQRCQHRVEFAYAINTANAKMIHAAMHRNRQRRICLFGNFDNAIGGRVQL